MGHFGRAPIRIGWFGLVLPALLLNYFGQGAMLLEHPEAVEHPFFELAPDWGVLPLAILATFATVIASQALISGVFSLTRQAVQLGYWPRTRIVHTSSSEAGQIYLPAINWALMVACIGLVLAFRSSTNLAAAYGVAVTSTMVITTVLFYVVLRERFRWGALTALALCGGFMVVDIAFLSANLFKIPDGGWFPLVVGALVFTYMTTWHSGRRLVRERVTEDDVPLEDFVNEVIQGERPAPRVSGCSIFLFSVPGFTPPALALNMRHNGVVHERLVVVTVSTAGHAHVHPRDRATVRELADGIHQIQLTYGFIEHPNVPKGLTEGAAAALALDLEHTTYFLGAESLRVTDRPGMAMWRERLFSIMSRNATNAANYFGLPPDRVITVGAPVEL